jgi:hypothetical protein
MALKSKYLPGPALFRGEQACFSDGSFRLGIGNGCRIIPEFQLAGATLEPTAQIRCG